MTQQTALILLVILLLQFVDSVDTKVKSIVDEWRVRRDSDDYKSHSQLAFEGHGVLIVAKATVNDAVPLCLGLGTKGNVPKLVPCFYDGVVETFAENWETGAVILEETLPYNRWQIGPCTTDGEAKRL